MTETWIYYDYCSFMNLDLSNLLKDHHENCLTPRAVSDSRWNLRLLVEVAGPEFQVVAFAHGSSTSRCHGWRNGFTIKNQHRH
jgi:hypothetical protein